MALDGVDTLFIQEASALRVGTAYESGVEDQQLRRQCLKENPKFKVKKYEKDEN